MISQEEYELLKKCDDKFKWVARDKNTELWVYTKKPYKGMYRWDSVGNINLLPRRSKYLFQLIQWDDEEPYCISDLIKKYEERGDIGYTSEEYAEYLSKFNEKLLTESEEKMKKDKEWLKDEVARIYDTRDYWSVDDLRDEILDLINELDEPEVLSQEWVDDNSVYASSDGITEEYVHVDDLQNLLVPKQELPVIPKFVAELLRKNKKDNFKLIDTYGIALERGSWVDRKLVDWLQEDWTREDIFARAWLDGFTVEEEQKYYVSARDEEYGGFWFLSKNNNGDISIGVSRDCSEVDWDRSKLTEQEIKDYDSRYWAFAVPVEELTND